MAIFLVVAATNHSNNRLSENKNMVVLVKYKALENKANAAINGMTSLINSVRKEPHFVQIKILLDPKDSSNIMLYEEWSNAEYYSGAHMQTQHLQNFILSSRSFLAGPPDITMWHSAAEFK